MACLRAVVERRSGTVVLVAATLALIVLTLRLGGAATSHRVVVVVVVAVSLCVVVGPCASSALLSISLLPPWSVFIIGIVLNNKINISKAGSQEGEVSWVLPQHCLILTE